MGPGDEGFYASEAIITQSETAAVESSDTITQSLSIMMVSGGEVYAAAADPDFIIRYELNEGSGSTALDTSGNSNSGTINGGATYNSNTGDGSAYSLNLDGSNDYIRPTTTWGGGSDGITLCAWIYNAQTGADDGAIITKQSSSATADHWFMLGIREWTKIRIRVKRAEGTVRTLISAGTVAPADTWTHVAFTYEGTILKIYGNGVLTDSEGWSDLGQGIGFNDVVPIDIGGSTAKGEYFGGRIDDARIYSRALSAEELLAIYEGTEEPPPGGDLEGGSLDSVGAVQSGAVTAAYTLAGGSLDSVGAVQSGAVTAAYTLSGGSLDSVGAIQSGAVTAAYTLSGGSLDSVGALQSGEVTAAYTLAGGSLDSVGALQSGALAPPPGGPLEGGSLDSVGALQSGAITAAYTLEGGSLDSVGGIKSGSITSAFALEGGSLDSVGAVQSGATTIVKQLQGGSLDSAGAIQSGALGPFSYTLAGGSLDSVGAVKSGATANAGGAPIGIHTLVVRVHNDVGYTDSASFEWEIQETLVPPVWDPAGVPDRSDRINLFDPTLTYPMEPYVESNAGDLILWRLDSSPSGFTIDINSGVITGNASAGVGAHQLRVGVTNSIPPESLSNLFTWEILEELLPPQWDPAGITDKSDDDDTLPQPYDVSGFVDSNSGPLHTWSLNPLVTGFDILDPDFGIITAAIDAPPGVNSIRVQVYNNQGSSISDPFDWTIVPTTTDGVLHNFNADPGLWTHVRAGDAWGYDKNDTDRTVGTDVPIYEGCGWSGSVFTPDAGFTGIRIDAKSTNTWTNNTDMLHASWDEFQATRTSTVWSLADATQTAIYKTTSLAQPEALLVLSVVTQQIVAYTGQVAITPDFIRVGYINPSTTLRQNWTIMTNELTQAGITGESATGQIYCKYFQAEFGGFGGPTGPIAAGDIAVTRSAPALTSQNSDYGWADDDLVDGYCLQIKMRTHISNDGAVMAPGGAATVYSLGDVSSGSVNTSDYLQVSLRPNGAVRCVVKRGGVNVAIVTGTGDLQRGEEYDLRLRVDPANGIRMWVTGPGVSIDISDVGAFAQWSANTPDTHRLGSFYVIGDVSDTLAGSFTFKTVRLNRTVLTDGDIIGWS